MPRSIAPAEFARLHPSALWRRGAPAFIVGAIALAAAGVAAQAQTAPDPTADAYSTIEDRALVVAAPGVLANDGDAGDSVPSVVVAPAHGTLTLAADGGFSYVPAANFHGTDGFEYELRTSTGAAAGGAEVVLTVEPQNDPPTATPDSYSTAAGTTLTVVAGDGVLANDSDVDGDPLQAIAVASRLPAHGTLTLAADGAFTYEPVAGFMGEDEFSYRAMDGRGGSATTRVTLSVLAAADLGVTIAAGEGDVLPGTTRVVEVEVANLGPAVATGVMLEVVTSGGEEGLEARAASSSSHALGELAGGTNALVPVEIEIPAGATRGTEVRIAASVAGTTLDPNAGNNEVVLTLVVGDGALNGLCADQSTHPALPALCRVLERVPESARTSIERVIEKLAERTPPGWGRKADSSELRLADGDEVVKHGRGHLRNDERGPVEQRSKQRPGHARGRD